MKRFVTLPFVLVVICLLGCNRNDGANTQPMNESGVVDSLALQIHRLDSLYNSGRLLHIDIYRIGKLKSIDFSVRSIDVEGERIQYINLRKDIGNEYYYDWEDARILPAECPYLMSAIDTVRMNWKRFTDHEERYAYITKDDIRLFAVNEGGEKWRIALSVDYKKDRSEITLSEDELNHFIELLNIGLDKIKELPR